MPKLTGNEKAAIGGLVTGLATLIVQLQQSGQLTLKEFGYSAAAWVVTHAAIYITANTPKPPVDTPAQPQ